jgi:hypothetical protein
MGRRTAVRDVGVKKRVTIHEEGTQEEVAETEGSGRRSLDSR